MELAPSENRAPGGRIADPPRINDSAKGTSPLSLVKGVISEDMADYVFIDYSGIGKAHPVVRIVIEDILMTSGLEG